MRSLIKLGISGIFVRPEGQEGKVAIRTRLSRFHDSYDVQRLCREFDEIDIVRHLIKTLAEAFPDFVENVLFVDERERKNNPHRSRRYFAKRQSELYPKKEIEFAREHSEQLCGLWIANNVGAKEIRQMVKEMCDACEIEFIADLRF